MNTKAFIMSLATGVVAVGLTGCGGGGGSSQSSTVENEPISAEFPTNAVSAAPTLQNGEKVKDAVTKNNLGPTSSILSVSSPTSVNVGQLSIDMYNKINDELKNISKSNYALNEVVDETEACDVSGSIHWSGYIGESGAEITAVFDNCNDSYLKINGTIYAKGSDYIGKDSFGDEIYKNITLKYMSDFTYSVGDQTFTIYKNSFEDVSNIQYNEYGEATNYTLYATIIADDGIQKYGIRDAKYQVSQPNWDDMSFYQTQGKVYIDNLTSYVDYDTSYDMSKTPFVYNDFIGYTSGEARYVMAHNGKVKIVAQNGEANVYVDADNDGEYELHDQY